MYSRWGLVERMIRDADVPCRGKDDEMVDEKMRKWRCAMQRRRQSCCSPVTPSLCSYSLPASSRTPHMCCSRRRMVIKLRFTNRSGWAQRASMEGRRR
ncbi:hypothetical protein FF1_034642 [Malus domestica]